MPGLPPSLPSITCTAPCSPVPVAAMCSNSAVTARSATLSPLKSPISSVKPKRSPASAVSAPGTAADSWVKNSLRVKPMPRFPP